jgi:hypothetical protein
MRVIVRIRVRVSLYYYVTRAWGILFRVNHNLLTLINYPNPLILFY